MNKNILFLDFDGVVNVPWWWQNLQGNWSSDFNFPESQAVNQTQAVQWVSEFCEQFNYDIVITSSWRLDCTVTELESYLRKAGLRDGVNVIGKTPDRNGLKDGERGDEITHWLMENPAVKNYLIFDDQSDMNVHSYRLVKTRSDVGFMSNDFNLAKCLHQAFNAE